MSGRNDENAVINGIRLHIPDMQNCMEELHDKTYTAKYALRELQDDPREYISKALTAIVGIKTQIAEAQGYLESMLQSDF